MKSIERAFNQAVTASMPDMEQLLENILATDVTPMTSPDSIVRQQPQKQHGERFLSWLKDVYSRLFLQPALLCSLCLLLILCLSTGAAINSVYIKTDTLVAIDVNPSIELSTNKKNKVISVNAKNKDADIILEDMELINVDLNIAVNAIIGSMLKHGYLQDDENTVLISVSNKKGEKARQIQNKIEEDFVNSLKVVDRQANFIKQEVSKDNDLEEMANELNISIGKLQFINQILELDDTLDITVLASMSMNELAALAQKYELLPTEQAPSPATSESPKKPVKAEEITKPADPDSNSTLPDNNTSTHDDVSNNNSKPGKLNGDEPDNVEDDDDYEYNDNDDDDDWGTDWEDEEDDNNSSNPSDNITPESPGKLNNTKPTEGVKESGEE